MPKKDEPARIIKSAKLSLKYLNKDKSATYNTFLDEYRRVVRQYIDIFWDRDDVPVKIDKTIYSKITDSWLTWSAIQCAGQQASGIVRGTRAKLEASVAQYNIFVKEGKLKAARKLKAKIDASKVSKPDVKHVEPRLFKKFFSIDWDNATSFDGIISLTSLGNKLKIVIPVKRHRHFNKLSATADKMCNVIVLSKANVTMSFEMPLVAPVTGGTTIGLDIGMINAFTTSDAQQSAPDIHGHTLNTIAAKLARKTKGSRAFARAQAHRTNYTGWAFNRLNLKGVSTLRVENIKYLRRGRKTSRQLTHFAYPQMYTKLQDLCNSYGCSMEKINPTYTSQRCSKCGRVRSSNRQGRLYKCDACKTECDSDYNAALNIAADLPPIGKAVRLKRKNRKGFCWNAPMGTPIVSLTKKP